MNIKKIANKIWSASPKSIYAKLHKLAMATEQKIETHLVTIQGGFAAGSRMVMPVPTPPTYESMVSGTYESCIVEKIIEKMQPEGKVIWDIGAHIGYQTFAFAHIVGEHGKVVAFEPNPNNVAWLTKNISSNPELSDRITVRTEAVSDKTGQTTFSISNNTNDATTSGGYITSVTPPLPDSSYEAFSTTSVKTISIDDLLAERTVQTPDLIKIDVEGAERTVLIGAKNTLATVRPKLIIEIHTIPMMLYVSELLTAANYTIEILDENDTSIFTKVIYAEYKN